MLCTHIEMYRETCLIWENIMKESSVNNMNWLREILLVRCLSWHISVAENARVINFQFHFFAFESKRTHRLLCSRQRKKNEFNFICLNLIANQWVSEPYSFHQSRHSFLSGLKAFQSIICFLFENCWKS